MTYDIISYLEDKDIEHWTEGENVTEGWVNIQCLFCDDDFNHLGINLTSYNDTHFFNCWKCGEKGSIQRLVANIEHCSYTKAKTILEQYNTNIEYKKEKEKVIKSTLELPYHTTTIPPEHAKYLIGRGFDPQELVEKYSLVFSTYAEKYRFKIIIPIYMNKQLVCFNTRGLNKKDRYESCPNEEAIIPIKQTIYNIDTVKDIAVIVEGPTDVWKLGDGAIATWGTAYTREQILLLARKRIKLAHILFDPEPAAQKQANKLAQEIGGFIPIVKVHELISYKDPGEIPRDEARQLMSLLMK